MCVSVCLYREKLRQSQDIRSTANVQRIRYTSLERRIATDLWSIVTKIVVRRYASNLRPYVKIILVYLGFWTNLNFADLPHSSVFDSKHRSIQGKCALLCIMLVYMLKSSFQKWIILFKIGDKCKLQILWFWVEVTRVTWSTSVYQAPVPRLDPSLAQSAALSSNSGEESTPCPWWWLRAVNNKQNCKPLQPLCPLNHFKDLQYMEKWVDSFNFAFDFTCSFQMLALSTDISSTLWFIRAISMFSSKI